MLATRTETEPILVWPFVCRCRWLYRPVDDRMRWCTECRLYSRFMHSRPHCRRFPETDDPDSPPTIQRQRVTRRSVSVRSIWSSWSTSIPVVNRSIQQQQHGTISDRQSTAQIAQPNETESVGVVVRRSMVSSKKVVVDASSVRRTRRAFSTCRRRYRVSPHPGRATAQSRRHRVSPSRTCRAAAAADRAAAAGGSEASTGCSFSRKDGVRTDSSRREWRRKATRRVPRPARRTGD